MTEGYSAPVVEHEGTQYCLYPPTYECVICAESHLHGDLCPKAPMIVPKNGELPVT